MVSLCITNYQGLSIDEVEQMQSELYLIFVFQYENCVVCNCNLSLSSKYKSTWQRILINNNNNNNNNNNTNDDDDDDDDDNNNNNNSFIQRIFHTICSKAHEMKL